MSPGRFFHYQHHLKKWIPTPNSFRLEFNDQLLEWQILVSVRSESHLACSLQQFTEGGITLEPGPEHPDGLAQRVMDWYKSVRASHLTAVEEVTAEYRAFIPRIAWLRESPYPRGAGLASGDQQGTCRTETGSHR